MLEQESLKVMVLIVHHPSRPVTGCLHRIPVTTQKDLLFLGLDLLNDLSKVVEQK